MGAVSSPKKAKRGRGKSGVPTWLLFPPVLLIPIFLFLNAAGNQWNASRPSMSFAAFFGMVYIALSVTYCTLASKNNRRAANVVSMLAHGAVIVFLADWTGAPGAFGGIGGIVFLFGAINAMYLLSPSSGPRFAKGSDAILPAGTDRSVARHILDAIVFPAAFLEFDENGLERVFASNEALARLLGKGAEKMQGLPFAPLLPTRGEEAKFKFADMEWVARRATKGKQTLFMLSPVEKSAEPPIIQVLEAIDPDTGLFTKSFMEYKGKSDVEGCRRYKRKLSISALRLDFDRAGEIPPSEETRKAAFNAFGRMVRGTIRDCDSAYRVSDAEIILMMPDTAFQGAKVVLARIRDRMRKLATMECAALGSVTLLDGTAGFAGEDAQSLDHVMREVYVAIKRENNL